MLMLVLRGIYCLLLVFVCIPLSSTPNHADKKREANRVSQEILQPQLSIQKPVQKQCNAEKKKKTSSVQRALQVQSAVPGFPGHRNQSVALELGACADWLENAEASARATDQITRAKKKKILSD